MRRSTFLLLTAVIHLLIGLGLLVDPQIFMSSYGAVLNPISTLLSRDVGTFLLAIGVANFTARNASDGSALQGILAGNLCLRLILFVLDLRSVSAGVVGIQGWGPVALHLALAIGFAYYLFFAKDQPSSITRKDRFN